LPSAGLQGKMHPCWLSLVIAVGAGLARAAGPPAQWMGPPGRFAGHHRPHDPRALRPPAACAFVHFSLPPGPLGIPGASCTDGDCVDRLRGGGRKQEDDGSDDSDGVIGSKVGKSKKKPTPAKAVKKAESEDSGESEPVRSPSLPPPPTVLNPHYPSTHTSARSSVDAKGWAEPTAWGHRPSTLCAAYASCALCRSRCRTDLADRTWEATPPKLDRPTRTRVQTTVQTRRNPRRNAKEVARQWAAEVPEAVEGAASD